MNRWRGLHPRSSGWGSDRVVSVAVNKTHPLPGLDLSIGVNVRCVVVSPGGRVDGSGLGYQKRSGDRGTLGIILHTQFGVNVVFGGSSAGERCENNAVREGH